MHEAERLLNHCWATPEACAHPDGTCCFTCCCNQPPSPSPPPSPPAPAGSYCPAVADLGFDYNDGGGEIFDQGWSVTGGARIHSRAAFNLLGGFIEFDMDVSKTQIGINSNLYTISPDLHGAAYESSSQYCDGQGANGLWCMELDILEANGYCGGATTIHAVPGHGGGCDAGGCQETYSFNSRTFHVRADWSENGDMITTIGGNRVQVPTDAGTRKRIVETMLTTGAVVQSSQWSGWVPGAACGPEGSLAQSSFTVRNLVVHGKVVSGPKPATCQQYEEQLQV